MGLDKKNAVHAVNGSTDGRREQVLTGLVSAISVHETGRPVKGRQGFGADKASRLAAMLTEGQRQDVLRLATAIVSNLDT